jgi:hypothetical protein
VSEREIPVEERLDAIYHLLAIVFMAVGAVHGAGAFREVLTPGGQLHTVATQIRSALIVIVPLLLVWLVWRTVSLKARAGRGKSLAGRWLHSRCDPAGGRDSGPGDLRHVGHDARIVG